MGFQCPQCENPGSLGIVTAVQLFRGHCVNEITMQLIECSHCNFAGLAVYEEGRLEPSDTRAWKHSGYRLPPGMYDRIMADLKSCPDQLDPECSCKLHRDLSGCDARGEWLGIEKLGIKGRFPMRLDL